MCLHCDFPDVERVREWGAPRWATTLFTTPTESVAAASTTTWARGIRAEGGVQGRAN
jgi:hypothetical protein